jgi:hypothetical protein
MKIIKYPLFFLLMICSAFMSFYGCGYHFRADGMPVNLEIKSIAIPMVAASSSERDFEADFTRTIREQFIRHAGIPVVTEERADVILACRVYEIDSQPLTYDSVRQDVQGRSVTYETTSSRRLKLGMEASLTERSTGKTVWHERIMEEEVRYSVTGDPLVTRHNQQQAVREAARLFAEKIYMMTMERF